MPEGLVRPDVNTGGASPRKGTPVTLPKNFGQPIILPHQFGITIPNADPTTKGNPVTWAKSPAHFGNIIGGSGGGAAPTLVQQKMAMDGSSAGTTTTIVLDAPATAGHSLVVFVTVQNSHTSASVPTDNAGNVYTLVRGPDNVVGVGGTANTYVYACLAVTGAPQTITLTASTAINTGPVMSAAVETTAAHLDTTISNQEQFNFGGDIDGGPIVTTADDLLLLFAFFANGGGSSVYSAGTGWTMVSQLHDVSFIGQALGLETQHAATPGSHEALIQIATNAGNGVMTTVALKG